MISLSTRLSFFFLSAIAIVLVGFSTAIYLLADRYLHRQFQTQLNALLDTLTAAAEVEPDGMQWEPAERRIFLTSPGLNNVAWVVFDDAGTPQDGGGDARVRQAMREHNHSGQSTNVFVENKTWLSSERRLTAPRGPALTVAVALPSDGIRSTVNRLAFALIGLSVAIWVSSAIAGRWFARRALRPVNRMAEEASRITANDLSRRLQVHRTGDELEHLGTTFNDLLGRIAVSFETAKPICPRCVPPTPHAIDRDARPSRGRAAQRPFDRGVSHDDHALLLRSGPFARIGGNASILSTH